MGAGPTLDDVLDRLAPPLQTDLAQHRLAGDFMNFGEFEVEGEKGQEGRPCLGRRQQGRQPAFPIVLARRLGAKGDGVAPRP